jgi:hypothetical protein
MNTLLKIKSKKINFHFFLSYIALKKSTNLLDLCNSLKSYIYENLELTILGSCLTYIYMLTDIQGRAPWEAQYSFKTFLLIYDVRAEGANPETP